MGWIWRSALLTAAVGIATVPWGSPVTASGLLAAVPLLAWAGFLGRSKSVGPVVGVVLLLLLTWIDVPRAVGWNGRWLVASLGDVFTWYPWICAGICALGVRIQRGRAEGPEVLLPTVLHYATAILVAGLAVCGTCPVWWLVDSESAPGDEGLLPVPAGLRVVEDTSDCGSGGCARLLTVTGDRADERLRAHLAARGFRLHPDRAWDTVFSATAQHETGVLVPHRVWLGYRVAAGGDVHIVWDVDAVIDL